MIINNVKLVLENEVVHGSLEVQDGEIRAFAESQSRLPEAMDGEGGWLLPGPVSYTHLDVYKRQVMDTLRDINQNDGITVVVTLHQVDYALRYCERIVALRQGHVFYDGSSQQFDNERFDHLYRSINRVEENAKAA